jgi:hypothetical protein
LTHDETVLTGLFSKSLQVNLSARREGDNTYAALWQVFQGEYESEDKEFP